MIIRHVAAAAVTAAAVTAAAGCGSSTSTGGTGSGTGGTSHSASPAARSASAPAAASGHSAFCVAARRYNTDQVVIDQAVAEGTRGALGSHSVVKAGAALRAARDAEITGAKLPRLAPRHLQASFRTVTTTWKPFFAAIIGVKGHVTKMPLSAEQRLTTVAKKPLFQAAARATGTYNKTACGLTSPHAH